MQNARAAYLDAAVATAGPARLLMMLCDRLVLDVSRGVDALRENDLPQANAQLVHAQEIVLELRSSLNVEAWSGGPSMAALYDYLRDQLVRANVAKDVEIGEACLELATQITAAWREAALHGLASVTSAAG